jgi:hypothetical protein
MFSFGQFGNETFALQLRNEGERGRLEVEDGSTTPGSEGIRGRDIARSSSSHDVISA